MTDNLRSKASERYAQARTKAGQALSEGRARAGQALTEGRARAGQALDVSRERARETAAATRARAVQARDKAAQGLKGNPLAAVAGGLAVGAIIAALLPRTAREKKLVGPVSRSVKNTARTAAKVAGTVAKAELVALGVSGDTARKQVRDLAGKIGKAASSAGEAAVKTVRKEK
ncbi:MAG: hypothetical protein RJB22_2228 [Pseudomonadota bacterium]|jgi:ElaB/YqjD/DUF883 family membrane-anchored ribosome-binding protein